MKDYVKLKGKNGTEITVPRQSGQLIGPEVRSNGCYFLSFMSAYAIENSVSLYPVALTELWQTLKSDGVINQNAELTFGFDSKITLLASAFGASKGLHNVASMRRDERGVYNVSYYGTPTGIDYWIEKGQCDKTTHYILRGQNLEMIYNSLDKEITETDFYIGFTVI